MRVLAIIPAREGSKGIKDKNVAACNGRPLIAWTIDAARKAGEIDRLIISTDSLRYRDILEHDYGADLFPFIRPEKYAKDKTPSSEVVIHALDKLEELGEEPFDIVVLLEPTSPLRTPEQINEAIQLLKQAPRARAIVSVVEDSNHHPLLAFEIQKNGQLVPYGTLTGPAPNDPIYPGHPRRQALRPAYFMSGDIYLSYVDTYRERMSFNHELTAAYKVQHWQAPEVDEPHDLIVVDALLKARQGGRI
jgi:CMP-N-acetylneuraminic acid synthetase